MSLIEQVCPNCGIHFGHPADVEAHWKSSSKLFYCPNGHGVVYPKTTSEVELLRKEVAELKAKLASSLEREETQKKKIEELQNEIDIWHPVTKTE
jgi:hypothetical protein